MTTVFVPQETTDGETRVAATPDSVKRMVKRKIEVTVQKGAGDKSFIADKDFEDAGAKLADDTSGLGTADVVLKVNPPTDAEIDALKEGALLVDFEPKS